MRRADRRGSKERARRSGAMCRKFGCWAYAFVRKPEYSPRFVPALDVDVRELEKWSVLGRVRRLIEAERWRAVVAYRTHEFA